VHLSHLFSANHLPDPSLKTKKSGEHVATDKAEAFYKFCIFLQNWQHPVGIQAPSKHSLQAYFGQGQHDCPGESWKKIHFRV